MTSPASTFPSASRSIPALFAVVLASLASACGGEAGAAMDRAQDSGEALDVGQAQEILVYKSPTCTCCEAWIEHLRAEGFQVRVEDRPDVNEVKNLLGIPLPLRSCHTAQVGNYLVEGHVPASDIRRLLAEKPQVAGLAAPGMPIGSPGMEVPGRAADRYQVLTFNGLGETEVFATH